MKKRINYYQELAADYSKPGLVSPEMAAELIAKAENFIALKEDSLPAIAPDYPLEQIERENKEWWGTHCEALRQGRGDLLTGEYRQELVYFCQDGPYYGLTEQQEREKHLDWAVLSEDSPVLKRRGMLYPGSEQ